MRVLVTGTVDVPAERRDQALTEVAALLAETLTERGCLAYSWTVDPNHPGRIAVFEEWESEADLSAHLAGPYYRAMFDHLMAVGVLAADNRKHRVLHSEPVYDAEGRPRGDFFTEPG